MKEIIILLNKKKAGLFLVLLITFLAYANTLGNQFVIEDEVFISNWPLTQNLSNIPRMIAGDTIPTGNWGAYRPVRAIIYSISYQLFGGDNPFWYHLQALIVHLTITALVFLIAEKILKAKLLAILAGLLFGLHPVHTEAVDYLTANFDIISYIFFFGSFLLYLYFKAAKKALKNTYLIGSIILAGLAFLSSEMTLTLPFLIVLYDFIFERKLFNKKNWSEILKLYGGFFGTALIFLFVRFVIMNINVRGEYLGGSIYFTFLTMLKVILRYFEWLIFPINLSINPILPGGISAWNHPLSHPERILEQSIFDPVILLSLGILGGLGILGIKTLKKHPIITFSIGWFFISILPVLHIIPQGTIFQERYIYIASFGYVLLLSFLAGYLYTYKWNSDLKQIIQFSIITFLIILLIFYSARTFFRNRDWKDSLAVWSKLAEQSPSDVVANFHTARLYKDLNQDELAIMHYNQALAVEPNLFEVHFSLGQIYLKNGRVDESMKYFNNALKINPTLKSADNAIKNEELIAQSTQSAIFRTGINFIDYKLPSGFIFSFPFDWEIIEKDKTVFLKDPNQQLEVEIKEDTKPDLESPEDFVKAEKKTYGKLSNEGLAQIPGFDYAYVKVFQGEGILKYYFFLFKDEKVLKILVFPGNSPFMNIFNQIISSLRQDSSSL